MNKKKQGKQIDSIVNNIDKALEASGQFKGVTGKVKKKLYESGGKKVLKLAIKSQIGIFLMNCFLFKFILIGVMMVFLMLVAAGIVQFFEQDNKTLEDMNINWDDYQCTCIHLTPEEIAKVKAGGQVEVDGSNGSGINISGGSVVNAERGLSGYLWGNFPMEYFALSTNGERGSSDANIKVQVGDGGKAYTIMQLDYRYDLHNWITQVYNKDPVTWSGLAEFQSYSAKDDRYLNNQNLINVLNEVYTTQPLKYISDLPNFFYNEYCSLTNRLYALGIDFEKRHAAVQSAYISASINCGEENLVNRMESVGGLTSSNGSIMSDEELIDCIYIAWRDYRISRANTDGSSSASASMIKDGHRVGNKGTGGEWDLAIMFLKGQWTPSTQNNPIGQSWAPGWDYANSIKLATKVTPTNDTTASFGQTGTGTTQSNSGNSGLSTNTSTDYDLNSFSIANNANLMVVVEGTGGSNCAVKAFEKSGSIWEERVNTIGVLGANGMSANRIEGDKTTPIGVFKMNTPFGQADALDGFPSDYFKVDKHDYWSDETDTYNKHVRDETRVVSGEAIGTDGFAEIYDYVIDSGYNVGGIEKKGSALFLHCTKANKVSTAGCVAIPKDDMATIMKLFAKYENNSYIIQGIKGSVKDLYNAYNDDGLSPSSSGTTNGSTGGSGTNGVQQNTLKYSNGEKISLDSSWEYASYSKINSGAATYYVSTAQTKKNICITVNAGHGCSGGENVKTQSHPDGTGKYTSGTTAQGEKTSIAISSGMTFKDNTLERTANLNVALKLKDKLLENGYDVLMIRESDDEQLDNIARTVISNNVSDAHIAIHFDSTDNDKGAFYMKVVDVEAYKNMSPVKEHWQEHDALGESLLNGLSNAGVGLWSTRALDSDLTQTSYSVIPSIDIELGDRGTTLTDELYTKYAEGLALGVEEFFKTHTPSNQAKRGISNISNESGNNSGTTNGGTVNKNLNNLRTKCMMKEEGICGCYISDPSCMCHVLAGEDGVIGTDDDGQISTDETVNNQQSGNGIQIPADRLYTFEEIKSTGSQRVLDSALVTYQQWYNTCRSQYSSDYLYAMHPSKPGYNRWFPDRFDGTHNSRGYRDCSTYASEVVYNMGITSVGYGSTADIVTNFVATGKFAHSTFSTDSLLPGDIVNITGVEKHGKKGGAGHVQIFVGWADDSKNSAYWYSWGGNSQVEGYPKNGLIITGPNAFVSNNYRHILRYIGE